MTKGIALCSVKKPATNSLSASGKSNGVRLVSANAEIKKIRNKGNNGIIYQTLCWVSIIFIKLNDPFTKITVNTALLNINSYLIICAVLRKDPKKAYLELALHPANKIPYTPTDDIANEYKIPKEKSDRAKPLPKGITAQPNKLKINLIIGAK